MAADPPLNRLALSAASVADDLGYVALSDLGHALGEVTADYRIISKPNPGLLQTTHTIRAAPRARRRSPRNSRLAELAGCCRSA